MSTKIEAKWKKWFKQNMEFFATSDFDKKDSPNKGIRPLRSGAIKQNFPSFPTKIYSPDTAQWHPLWLEE